MFSLFVWSCLTATHIFSVSMSPSAKAAVPQPDVPCERWQMVFKTEPAANKACKDLRNINETLNFCKPGTWPTVCGTTVNLQWRAPSKYVSVKQYFGKKPELRDAYGPGGAVDYSLRVHQTAAATEPARTYEFDKCTIWSNEARQHLEAEGFVVAKGFVPEDMTTAARVAVEEYMTEVLRAFQLPDVSELRDIGKVPPRYWTVDRTRNPQQYHPMASVQKWGCSTSTGYMHSLGNGQALAPKQVCRYPAVVSCQVYPRFLLAHLLETDPEKLCWKSEYVSIKSDKCAAAPLHRDTHDDGRLQAVVMLSDGSVVGCPGSHRLPSSKTDLKGNSHYHATAEFVDLVQSQTPAVEMPLKAGDVFIFHGGTFVHGCPAVSTSTDVRIVTYASFWPPGTTVGNKHAAGKCKCPRFQCP